MSKKKEEQRTKILSAKVTPLAAQTFAKVARSAGLKSPYELLQLMIDCIVRYADAPHDSSATLRDVVDLFFGSISRQSAQSLGMDGSESVYKSICFIRGTHSKYGVMVSEPFMGCTECTSNIQDMITEFLSVCMPKELKKLKVYMRQEGLENITQAFMQVVNDSISDGDEDFAELFADNERDLAGRSVNVFDRKYATHHRVDINGSRFELQKVDKQRTVAKAP